MGRIVGLLIVNFVLSLISFIAYSSQIFVIWPWYGRELSVELITLLLPFNILVGLLFWNYYLCVNTDPGIVPESWRPDTHMDGYEVKKLTGAPRYCRMCHNYKPPRSHHCRQCNRCILRMDHHCPWINNCVGHFNYGHFIRFLFFVDVACSYHATMVVRRVMDAMYSPYWNGPSTIEFIFIVLNFVACMPVLLSVGGFSIYHFNALLRNTTTIERWEKDKAATLVRKGKISEVKFPYDLGRRRNIEAILGKRALLWCCPTRTPGTGLKYELSTRDEGSVIWPPQDPDTVEVERYDQLQNYNRGDTYQSVDDEEDSLVSSDDEMEDNVPLGELRTRNVTVRRGSEGYEVRPISREEMLREYMDSVGEDYDRYLRYIPQPDSDGEDIPIDDSVGLEPTERWET
ncbi:hypothetical protein Agabi119p4_323 [Agaricus bisporus var. burnettii]|uniref:Palmitoyltransferase PFA4 n=1 Tax=Agaricus bisporus var. burnettii TaxID=192524 RepID=A0A8H7FAQ2_AGABI|nr:hypothetical protein Agabi119p4_323 [Agaricus bisporus var. burnettii]